MSTFEEELSRAKQRQLEQQAELAKKALDERASWLAELEEKQRKVEEAKRREYRRVVNPIKPEVDELMESLARQTWGRGNYGKCFIDANLEHVEGERRLNSNFGTNHSLAKWMVGRTETRGRDNFHGAATYKWHPKLKSTPTDKYWSYEYFRVSVDKNPADTWVFDVSGVGLTSSTETHELRGLLVEAFLNGPQHETKELRSIKEGG